MSGNNGETPAGQRKLTAYLGHVLTPTSFDSFESFRDGALVVDEQGKIAAVGHRQETLSKLKPHTELNFGDRLLMPGFVDLHVHLVQIAQTGRSGDTLLGWLTKYIFPAEIKFQDINHARKLATWFFNEMAKNGTTLGVVFTSIHASATDVAFQTAADMGSRVIMGKVMMDRNSPPELTEDTAASLEQSAQLAKKWHNHDGGRLRYAFTPRFAPTSTRELLQGVAKLWQQNPGTYMQTHLSENLDEIAWVRDLYPECWNYFDVYRSHGLSGPRSLFAHSIHLDEGEIRKMSHDGCGVAHCPSSNFFLKSGIFPLLEMLKHNVKFGLGSDIAAGPEMSMFRVMKDASYIQPDTVLTPAQLFYLSTLAGATAINLQDSVGSLAPGKEADFIVVDPTAKTSVKSNILEKTPEDILSSLAYVGDDRMVCATFVRGRCIYGAETVDTLTQPGPKGLPTP
jgi:guanine deaminase